MDASARPAETAKAGRFAPDGAHPPDFAARQKLRRAGLRVACRVVVPSVAMLPAALLLAMLLAALPATAARQTLRLPIMGDIPTLDPGLAEDTSSIEIIEQLFLGLTDFDDRTTEVVPELAKDWSVGKDGLTYTFRMRKAVWSDGRPVTAHDIVWAVRRNIAPATASPYAYMMYGIKGAEAINTGRMQDTTRIGVRALDDYTVRFTLERPAAYFPAVAGLWVLRPLPRHVLHARSPGGHRFACAHGSARCRGKVRNQRSLRPRSRVNWPPSSGPSIARWLVQGRHAGHELRVREKSLI